MKNANNNLKENLFAGPTQAQMDRIQGKQNAQSSYMKYVYANPNATIEQLTKEYNRLMSEVN
jgi:hypothetical protein